MWPQTDSVYPTENCSNPKREKSVTIVCIGFYQLLSFWGCYFRYWAPLVQIRNTSFHHWVLLHCGAAHVHGESLRQPRCSEAKIRQVVFVHCAVIKPQSRWWFKCLDPQRGKKKRKTWSPGGIARLWYAVTSCEVMILGPMHLGSSWPPVESVMIRKMPRMLVVSLWTTTAATDHDEMWERPSAVY